MSNAGGTGFNTDLESMIHCSPWAPCGNRGPGIQCVGPCSPGARLFAEGAGASLVLACQVSNQATKGDRARGSEGSRIGDHKSPIPGLWSRHFLLMRITYFCKCVKWVLQGKDLLDTDDS